MSKKNQPKLILVDDDQDIFSLLSVTLRDEFEVIAAETRRAAVSCLRKFAEAPVLALVDLGLPPLPHLPDEGFCLIRELLAINNRIKILVLSGQSDLANIKHALTIGAVDFIPKPCDISLIKARLGHQLLILEAERTQQRRQQKVRLIGESVAIRTLKDLINQFADSPYSVLIEGDSGTGKELVARLLHEKSDRQGMPYLTISCAAFTAELLDAQLFGYAKGSFTGAESSRAGFFQEARNGILFLDEIGELPFELQAKLLRVLESGEYYAIGETKSRISKARIIAATNRDLRREVRAGRFRKDLYHRLSVLSVYVPPLKSRGSDCLKLLDYFQDLYSATGRSAFECDAEARKYLLKYEFPGNIRELRNIVIRLGTKYPGKVVGIQEVQAELEIEVVEDEFQDDYATLQHELIEGEFCLKDRLEEYEKSYINMAMRLASRNFSRAARMLGLNRTTFYSRVKKLNI